MNLDETIAAYSQDLLSNEKGRLLINTARADWSSKTISPMPAAGHLADMPPMCWTGAPRRIHPFREIDNIIVTPRRSRTFESVERQAMRA